MYAYAMGSRPACDDLNGSVTSSKHHRVSSEVLVIPQHAIRFHLHYFCPVTGVRGTKILFNYHVQE